jgi:hypothetical protein
VFDLINVLVVTIILVGMVIGIAFFLLVASERELLLGLAAGCAVALASWFWFAVRRRPS